MTGAGTLLKRHWPALLCAVAGLAVFQFAGNANRGYIDSGSLFIWWVSQWLDPRSEMEHAWLVLGLAVWMFFSGNREIGKSGNPSSPERFAGHGRETAVLAWRGAVVAMVGGLLLHALGFQVQQARISVVALLIFLWGALALAGGPRWGRAAWVPLAFMLFALPMGFLNEMGFWLRLWVIKTSHGLVGLAGYEVLRSGTQLCSADGRYQYEVVAACSGVRSLQALMALSFLAGYVYLRGWTGRLAVLALSLPFSFLGNVVRVSAIIFATEWWGNRAGLWVHEWAGFIVFAVVLGLVMLAVRLLGKREAVEALGSAPPATAQNEPSGSPALPKFPDFPISRFPDFPKLCIGVAVFAVLELAGLLWLARGAGDVAAGVRLAPEGVNPAELPVFIGGEWAGRRQEPTRVERELLPADTGYSRKLYTSMSRPDRVVLVSVVLSGRDRSSIHRPELCLVGQGWGVLGKTREVFPMTSGGALEATVLRVSKAAQEGGAAAEPGLVAYWFIGRDVVVASQGERMWRDVLDRLRGRPERWAYVLLQTSARDGEAAALGRLREVAAGAMQGIRAGG